MIKQVNKSTYESEVLKSKAPVIVDFWAPWCGPCRMQAPILEDLAKQYTADQLKIVKVNVDEERELAMAHGIQSIPTLLIYKDGEVVNKVIGVRDGATLKRAVGLA
jgi:thioredoxin 1